MKIKGIRNKSKCVHLSLKFFSTNFKTNIDGAFLRGPKIKYL